MNDKKSIEILSDDALIHLFQFFPPLERLRLKKVCCRWENNINLSWNDCNSISVVQKPRRKCRKMNTITVEELEAILKNCGHKIKKITLVHGDNTKARVDNSPFNQLSLGFEQPDFTESYNSHSCDDGDEPLFSHVTYRMEKFNEVVTLNGSSYVLHIPISDILSMIVNHCPSPQRVTFEYVEANRSSDCFKELDYMISNWIISNPRIEVIEIVCQTVGELLLNSSLLPNSIKNLSILNPCLDCMKQHQVETLKLLPSLEAITLEDFRFKGMTHIRNILSNPQILHQIKFRDWIDAEKICNVLDKFRKLGLDSDNYECPNIQEMFMVNKVITENYVANRFATGLCRIFNLADCSNLTYDSMLQILTLVPNLKRFTYTDKYATVTYMEPLVNFFISRAISNKQNLELTFVNTHRIVRIHNSLNKSTFRVRFCIWDYNFEATNLEHIIENSPESKIIFRKLYS